ncbi:UNVERIFIED_CONTAM: Retrovirus-related Pol polyprotein from transposon TNT 1-94, partial [Sesamum indicum]
GFTCLGEEWKVCRLQRSIYGLKQASRSWNTRFDEVIRCYDFIKNEFDPCVYKKISGRAVALFVLYVDDILLMGNDVKMLGDIKSPNTDEELKRMSDIAYASAVGSIQYVVQCTKPDIAYALIMMSRYQAYAREAHWRTIKTILKYLKRTKDMFLIYSSGKLILEGYNDASFQSDDNDTESQSGFVFKLNDDMVAWKSSEQDTTVNSTTKTEYMAASETTKKTVCIKNYIQELDVVPSIVEPIVIICDNNWAIAQAKESRSHHRF